MVGIYVYRRGAGVYPIAATAGAMRDGDLRHRQAVDVAHAAAHGRCAKSTHCTCPHLASPIRLIMISRGCNPRFWSARVSAVKQDVLARALHQRMVRGGHSTGEYHLFCDQYCGSGPFQDGGHDLRDGAGEISPMARRPPRRSFHRAMAGEAAFSRSIGCVTCHSSRARRRWLACMAEPCSSKGAASVTADENYLRESILYPSAQDRPKRLSPDHAQFSRGQLTEEQVMDLVAYIKSLSRFHGRPVPEMHDTGPSTQPDRAVPGPGPFLPERKSRRDNRKFHETSVSHQCDTGVPPVLQVVVNCKCVDL